MNDGNVSDFFYGIGDVFNPNFSYEGNYGFPLKSLYQCSKIEDGHNLVEEYFYKKHLKEIYSLLKGFESTLGNFLLVSDVAEDGKGRILKISLEIITYRICLGLVGDTPKLGDDHTKYKEILLSFFRKYKKAIGILQRNESREGFEKECEIILKRYQINEQFRKNKYGKNYRPQDIYSFLEQLRSAIIEFLVIYNRLVTLCDKSINLSELEENLDLEKFYFVMAKHLLDTSLIAEEKDGLLHNSFSYVDIYFNTVKYLKEHGHYDMELKFMTIDEGEKLVKLDDIEVIYNALKNRHPEFSLFAMEPEEGVDYQDVDVATVVKEQIQKLIDSNKLAASWNFIRKGEVERTRDGAGQGGLAPRPEMSEDEKNKELRKRLDFFESTDYIYRIEGINNFDGYVGFIYPNGLVIFEKFYKDTTSYELALSNATYVMNLDNFITMSKKTKVEIMEYIRQGNTDVIRKYHTGKWQENILSLIEGNGYDKDTVNLINNLIAAGEIRKKGQNNE